MSIQPLGHRESEQNREVPHRTFRSLPARITFFVFWATVISSLTVTATSVNSIHSFLRSNIEKKFPAALAHAQERLELWYDQRMLEIGVFANSEILEENLGRLESEASASRMERSRGELEQYLSYLLESFPQYDALFIRNDRGETVLWVGEPAAPPMRLPNSSGAATTVDLSGVVLDGDRRAQIASARLEDPRNDRASLGSLHALLRLDSLDEVLRAQDLEQPGRLFLVDPNGRVLAASSDWTSGEHFGRRLPALHSLPGLADYETDQGDRVVGSAIRLNRFDWTLVVEVPYEQAFAPVLSTISKVLAIDLAIVLLFGLLAYRIAVSIVRPIEALSDAARRLSEGDEHVVIPDSDARDEVGLLTRTFNAMTRGLANKARELEESRHEVEEANRKLTTRNEELHRMNEILEQLSITDGLTKLHNHRFFQDHLTREVRRVERTGEPLSLVLADIDKFKSWNDRLGHAAGDRILRDVARIMNGVIRESDLLARYGGEEFALLAPDTDLEGAVQLAEKIRSAIAEHTFVIGPPSEHQRVSLSFGVSLYRGEREAFFNEADRALYAAKEAGRDCVMTVEEAAES